MPFPAFDTQASFTWRPTRRTHLLHAGVAAFLLVISPAATSRLVTRHLRPPQTAQAPDVTEAEQAVLTLLCEGYSNAEIAEQLVVAESTVKTHVSHLMKKYDVPSRLKLVVAVHKTQGT